MLTPLRWRAVDLGCSVLTFVTVDGSKIEMRWLDGGGVVVSFAVWRVGRRTLLIQEAADA